MRGSPEQNHQTSAKALLKTKMNEMRTRNAAFSLRAFAKKTGIEASTLSRVLNGKNKITVTLVKKLCRSSVFSLEEKQVFFKNLPERLQIKEKSIQTLIHQKQLSSDQFKLLSEWHYFAILSLLRTDDFQSNHQWIARRLGLSVKEVSEALSTLIRLGIVKHNSETGALSRTEINVTTSDEVRDRSIQHAHLGSLKLAQNALEAVSLEKRDFTSLTLAIDPRIFPEVKKLIRKFQDELDDLVSNRSSEKTEVYRFFTVFFPLTNPEKKLN